MRQVAPTFGPLAVTQRTPASPHPRRHRGALVLRLVAVALVAFLLVSAVSALAPGTAAAALPGEHLWADTVFTTGVDEDEGAAAVATDASGYPVVVGTAVTDEPDTMEGYTDIRYYSYDLTGVPRWTAVPTTWDNPENPGFDDLAYGVVVDDARACAYVVGKTEGAGTGSDILVLKLRDADAAGPLNGALLWTRAYNGPASNDDVAEAVALDTYGNVYVTGSSRRADNTEDVVTLKYRPDGTLAWSRRHDNSTTRFDAGFAIAVRGTAVYVAGVSSRPGHRKDVVLIRYSLAGERQWLRYYDDALNRDETVTGIAATAGAVYVCGGGKSLSYGPGDALLLKYLSDGTRAWVRWVAGSGGLDDAWNDVAVDDLGRAHVTGFLNRAATGDDIVTRMYSTGGTLAWQRGFSSAGYRVDTGTALAVGGVRTYVCGVLAGLEGDTDIVVLKYGADGATLWQTTYPDSLGYPGEVDEGFDRASDIALAPGFVYVVGQQSVDHGGGADSDFLTLAIQR